MAANDSTIGARTTLKQRFYPCIILLLVGSASLLILSKGEVYDTTLLSDPLVVMSLLVIALGIGWPILRPYMNDEGMQLLLRLALISLPMVLGGSILDATYFRPIELRLTETRDILNALYKTQRSSASYIEKIAAATAIGTRAEGGSERYKNNIEPLLNASIALEEISQQLNETTRATAASDVVRTGVTNSVNLAVSNLGLQVAELNQSIRNLSETVSSLAAPRRANVTLQDIQLNDEDIREIRRLLQSQKEMLDEQDRRNIWSRMCRLFLGDKCEGDDGGTVTTKDAGASG